MQSAIARWGNSMALRLPKGVLEDADLKEGNAVDVRVENGALIITKARPKYSITELMDAFRPEHRHEDEDWGKPAGKEIW